MVTVCGIVVHVYLIQPISFNFSRFWNIFHAGKKIHAKISIWCIVYSSGLWDTEYGDQTR